MTGPEGSFRRIPSVDRILGTSPLSEELARFDRRLAVASVREILDEVRERMRTRPGGEAPTAETIAAEAVRRMRSSWGGSLRRVVNATGILIHTNLGRAPLAREAQQAVRQIISGYSSLEIDLETGRRRSRLETVSRMLADMAGAPAAMAVNNNAAALFLALHVLARGRPVAVSRGELVEIGGSFRLPDIIEASGVELMEVGTTNRTRGSDYRKAVEKGAALLLKVHASNYHIEGYVEETPLSELVLVSREASIPLVVDLGSGALDMQPEPARRGEPTVGRTLAAGADLVTASGDKLLGGPQAGLLWGGAELISRLRSHPLARVVRLDKILLGALEATLATMATAETGRARLPLHVLASRSVEELETCGEDLVRKLRGELGPRWSVDLVVSEAAFGGGSLPAETIESRAIKLSRSGVSAADLARRLRRGAIPVIGRILGDELHLDLRTLLDDDMIELSQLVSAAAQSTDS
jgi:L-seryl-tRNA(Ser) seleniumtransferase